ncbi:FAD-dependent oxidoreductase [Streptomyces griseus]|uniref:FAD-dependent oxidoreductase n=1 Tax=Streptomyces stephensoniae TaxID=3375367 RepID=A0ABU2WDQ3_9ACTN|nr:FAD-dependent oxidoreductase [Streptomyces griseus]MDT0495628.1 FAD-dependent oxidoreductase [Streptomyces griseus]
MGSPTVVVVGAGQAGSDTAAALRSQGFAGRIVLVGDEDALPYRKPLLSKEYLVGDPEGEDTALRPASFYAEQGIELRTGDPAVRIDREGRRLVLASGEELGYDHLVLATGARPRRLSVPGAELDGVLALRTLADARTLRTALAGTGDLLVVGGGFIGLEVAAAARASGVRVTVVETRDRLMGRSVSAPTARYLAEQHTAHGVRLLLSEELTALHGEEGRVRVAELGRGERIRADLVVAGVGVLPNTALAADAGLEVGDGILVDPRLRTADPRIHAIGDCARFPSRHAPRHLRLESVQNAADQARSVAAAIHAPADPPPYDAVPWFWTRQYGARLQIAGITDGHDRTVTVGDPAGGRFSVFCFRAGRLLGTESVNRPADHMITRRLLATGDRSLTPEAVAAPGFDLKHRQPQPA